METTGINAEKMKLENISLALLDGQRLLIQIVTSGCPESVFARPLPDKSPKALPPPEKVKELALPTLEASVFDEGGMLKASMLIVDHKEPECEITLHLAGIQSGSSCLLRIELDIENEPPQRIEKTFILQAAKEGGANGRDS